MNSPRTVEEATIDRLSDTVAELQEEIHDAWRALDVDGLDAIDAPNLPAAIKMFVADRAVYQRRIKSLKSRVAIAETNLHQVYQIVEGTTE